MAEAPALDLSTLAVGPDWTHLQTHVSDIWLSDELVVKTKKPIDVKFADYRARAARKASAENEVRLNRRIAPEVYLGVAEVDTPVGREPAVVMRRMRTDRSLAALVARGDGDLVPVTRDVARVVATFHARCPVDRSSDSPGSYERVRARWNREWDAVTELTDRSDRLPWAGVLRALGNRYLEGREALFDERLERGFVRDGHGDLQASDIFVDDAGVHVLDCLEFDASLRVGDVLLDIAFLVMDLERRGARDAARAFGESYLAFSGETHPPSLLHFFVAYRALVRMKVALIREQQGVPAGAELKALRAVCERHLRAGEVRAVCVGGLPASGKSTIALGIARRIDAEYLSSDEIRDELAGHRVRHPAPTAWESADYSPAMTDRVYDEMRRRARLSLSHGLSVVLDASWNDDRQRQATTAMAAECAARVSALRCVVPEPVARQRLGTRSDTYSDADEAVLERMSEQFSPWPEAVELDTDRTVPAALRDALGRLER